MQMPVASSLFRFLAVVDWLDLEVRTLKPTQGRHLHNKGAGAFSYCKPIKECHWLRSNTSTRFIVRIQNPERFATIAMALETIRDCLDLAFEIRVRGIEISFDAYRLAGTTTEQLAEMVVEMLRGINRPGTAPVRLYKCRGTAKHGAGRQSTLSAVLDGYTGMYGNQRDNFVIRGYLKDYDTVKDANGKGQRVSIDDPLEHRARIEVRLQGRDCPIHALDDLKHFRFESVAPFFKFRKPTEDLTGVASLIADRRACGHGGVIDHVGDLSHVHAMRGRGRKTAPDTLASPLNEISRIRLRKLSCRWQASTGRGRKARRTHPIACGSSDRLNVS